MFEITSRRFEGFPYFRYSSVSIQKKVRKAVQLLYGSSTFSVVHCGGDVEFTDGEVEHGD